MSEQLIYTYSHSVHGSVAVRMGRAMVAGYGVVGKSRGISKALEEELVALAKRGMAPEDMNPGAQYFYRTALCAGQAQHLFGCTRRAEEGENAGKYLCHVFVLSGEEVQNLWQTGSTLSPAGVLLVLTMSDFWVQKWEGPARWSERNPEPSWVTIEGTLQANQQPAWQHYTGLRETARLLQEPRFQEACMLAFPVGTPTQDMLRVLHEAENLRGDLGWCIPIFTHGGSEVTDMTSVMLLGCIGSRMQRRATMMGLPVLEVTEKLAEQVRGGGAGGTVPRVAPPTPRRQITADVTHIERGAREEGHGDGHAGAPRKVGRWVVGALLILAAAWGGYYVWQNFDTVKGEVEKLMSYVNEKAEEREQKQEEIPTEPVRTLSSEEEELLRGYIAPVRVGSKLPSCLARMSESANPVRPELGKLQIFPLGDASGEDAKCYDLGTGETGAELAHDGQTGGWRLVVSEANGEKRKEYTLRTEDGVLRGVTDEHGHPVAILLPVPVDGGQVGAVFLMPEWEPTITGEMSLEKGFAEKFTPQLTPGNFETTARELRFKRPAAADAMKGARGTVTCVFGSIALPDAAPHHTVSVVTGDTKEVTDIRLTRETRRSGDSFVRYRLQGACPFDFTAEIVRAVEGQANETRGHKARGGKYPAASVGGLFNAVTEVVGSTGSKRNAAITNYVAMFTDKKFAEYCAEELSHMPAPHESGYTKRGNRVQVDPQAMRRFEAFDYPGMLRYLCGWMGDVAKREFAVQSEKYARDMKCSLRLRLIRVEAPNPGELKWVFECDETSAEESGAK